MPSTEDLPETIDSGRFEVGKKLGAGCFAVVHRGRDTKSGTDVAIKMESRHGYSAPLLSRGADILQLLGEHDGVPKFHYYGSEGGYNCLVMELLGSSLEDQVQRNKGKFDVPTTLLVAEQVLCRIEYLHSKGIVHRDIKPDNFMCGLSDKRHHIYLIDFGLSKSYYDRKHQKHAMLKQQLSLTGTARYASITAHQGIEQSRRDDLEAIGYMFMYFLRGSLPWSGLDARTASEKYRKIMEKKQECPLSELCGGFPSAFERYIEYTRGLQYKQRPDYSMLRHMFRQAREELSRESSQSIEDHDMVWCKDAEVGSLVPLKPLSEPRQPDDPEPKPKPDLPSQMLATFGITRSQAVVATVGITSAVLLLFSISRLRQRRPR